MAEKVKTHPWDAVAIVAFIAAWALIIMGMYGLPPWPWALVSMALGFFVGYYVTRRFRS